MRQVFEWPDGQIQAWADMSLHDLAIAGLVAAPMDPRDHRAWTAAIRSHDAPERWTQAQNDASGPPEDLLRKRDRFRAHRLYKYQGKVVQYVRYDRNRVAHQFFDAEHRTIFVSADVDIEECRLAEDSVEALTWAWAMKAGRSFTEVMQAVRTCQLTEVDYLSRNIVLEPALGRSYMLGSRWRQDRKTQGEVDSIMSPQWGLPDYNVTMAYMRAGVAKASYCPHAALTRKPGEKDFEFRNRLKVAGIIGTDPDKIKDYLEQFADSVAFNPDVPKWTMTRGLMKFIVTYCKKPERADLPWALAIERVSLKRGGGLNFRAATLEAVTEEAITAFRRVLIESDPRPDDIAERLSLLLEDV
jgi:hypothetical protein